jgi:hypothetical protein
VKAQKQPTVNSEQIEAAIKAATTWQEGLLYAVLAGTGLRISECLSLRVGPIDGDDQTVWLADQSLIKVRSSIYQGEELRGRVKTQAAKRFVDLHSNLNEAIRKFVEASGIQAGEFLFQEDGNPLDAYVLRARAIRRGVPGFHSLRRFRISHLRSVPVLEDIIRYWVGHGPESITSLYAKLGEDVELRQQWATRAGLGFSLDRIGYPAPSKLKAAKPRKTRKTVAADPAVEPQSVVYTSVYTPETASDIESDVRTNPEQVPAEISGEISEQPASVEQLDELLKMRAQLEALR